MLRISFLTFLSHSLLRYYDMAEATMSTWKLRYQITDYEKIC